MYTEANKKIKSSSQCRCSTLFTEDSLEYNKSMNETTRLRKNEYNRLYRKRKREEDPDYFKSYHKKWRDENNERYNQYLRDYRGKPENQIKSAARRLVNRAIASGILTRPKICSGCLSVCKPEGHHNDYFKPLEVLWLCKNCHEIKHHP